MRKVVVLALVAAAGALAFACGDDDDKGGGSGINKCEGAREVPGASSCSEAQKKAYSDCIQTACDAKYAECYGPGYKSGKFSGVCGSYMECTSACDCNDSACYGDCDQSSECSSCTLGFVSCAASCQDELACALGDSGVNLADSGVTFKDGSISVGDANISTNKTCKDLLACCNSLSDASEKSDCMMVHSQAAGLGAQGDLLCSVSISSICP